MKLTRKDIGKKIRLVCHDSFTDGRYALLLNIRDNNEVDYVRFDKNHHVEKSGEIIKSGYEVDDGWELVDKTEVFNFELFGCNETAVRDLVTALDKRYNYKEKK